MLAIKSIDPHFPHVPEHYAHSRPEYPKEFFPFLADLSPVNQLAWDCATGNGQAAIGLSKYYAQVIATDANCYQLNLAERKQNTRYAAASGESAPIANDMIDLVTVGQALHWIDLALFWPETGRVLKPGGCLMYWFYDLGHLQTEAQLQQLLVGFYNDTLSLYLPASWHELNQPDSRFPTNFSVVSVPEFYIHARWCCEQFCSYLSSLGSIQLCLHSTGRDPLPALLAEVREVWPSDEERLSFRWRMNIHAARLNSMSCAG